MRRDNIQMSFSLDPIINSLRDSADMVARMWWSEKGMHIIAATMVAKASKYIFSSGVGEQGKGAAEWRVGAPAVAASSDTQVVMSSPCVDLNIATTRQGFGYLPRFGMGIYSRECHLLMGMRAFIRFPRVSSESKEPTTLQDLLLPRITAPVSGE